MRALLQRVSGASVAVQGTVIGQIGAGFVVLVCAMQGDGPAQAERLAAKIAKLRVFKDSAGKMNLSLGQVGGSALIVSQFTLAADLRGNRPGFSSAAPPAEAEALYHTFCRCIEAEGIAIATGSFGADMQVSLTNDGPVTIWMDTDQL